MKVALGLKAHSGWAVLVAIGKAGNEHVVVDRRRIELVRKEDTRWAKQPYHAAEDLDAKEAQVLIKQATKAAHRAAEQEIRAAVKRLRNGKHEIAVCAVLTPSAMPEWSVVQILAVHFRMHKAEGVLFPEALSRAAEKCGLDVVAVPEKTLAEFILKVMKQPLPELNSEIVRLGKTVGAPWGKDQKNAALAAIAVLK
jgi:hypothetical protein